MKCQALTIVVVALGVPILAQTKTVTSPSGYENSEAPSVAYYFGMHADGRQQFADGMQKGQGVKLISQVGYRLDYTNHTTSTGAGKSWTNVQLRMSNCDFAKVGNTFTANPTSSQTLVYNSSVTWPAQAGYPGTNPAPWSTSRGFPFITPWFYAATTDILLDYQFSGGKLANNASWGGSAATLAPYLDANSSYDYASWGITNLGTQNCVDSGQTVGAYVYLTGYTYPKNAGTVYDGKVYAYVTAYNVGFNANVAVALGLKGTNVTFPGVACNQLFVDVSASILLFGKTTATASWYFNSFGYVPFTPSMINLNLWGQAAWNDTLTGALKLSRAAQTVVQNQPPNPPPKKMIYASSASTSATVYGPFFSASRNPLMLYTY